MATKAHERDKLERQGLLVRDVDNSYLTADAVDSADDDPMHHLLSHSITYRPGRVIVKIRVHAIGCISLGGRASVVQQGGISRKTIPGEEVSIGETAFWLDLAHLSQ